jgi:hypothetical protein
MDELQCSHYYSPQYVSTPFFVHSDVTSKSKAVIQQQFTHLLLTHTLISCCGYGIIRTESYVARSICSTGAP